MGLSSPPALSLSLHAGNSGFSVLRLQACSHSETWHSLSLLPGMLFLYIFPPGSTQATPLQRRCPDHLSHQDPSPRCPSSAISSYFLSCTAFLTVWVCCSFMCLPGIYCCFPPGWVRYKSREPGSLSICIAKTRQESAALWAYCMGTKEQRNWSKASFCQDY